MHDIAKEIPDLLFVVALIPFAGQNDKRKLFLTV